MWILLCYLGLGLVVSAYGQNDGSCSRKHLEGNDRNVNESRSNSDDCFDKEFRDLLNMVNNLKGDALNRTVIAEIAGQLVALTNHSEGLSPGNLNASIIIINELTVLLRDSNSITLNGTEIESIVQAISNVLQTNNTESWKKLNDEDNEYNEYKLLPLIATVGCSISIAALIATIIVYALTWKQAKSAQATVLLNLCVALIIAYTIFLTGTDTVQSVIGCKVFHVMLHYFYLAAFFFMLAEGVELLLYTVFVFHVRTTRETIMLVAAAWVLPLIIVAVSQLSHGSNNGNGYSIGFRCWVSFVRSHIFALVGPILFVIAANFVILIIVLIWICKKRTCLASNAKKRNEIRAMLWNLSVAGPVLGLGWLVTSVLLLSIGHVVLFYLFIIINSSQGTFIFIFHALLHNKTVKEKISSIYQNYICSCRKTFEEPPKKKDKSDLLPMAFRDNKGIEIQGSVLSSGTHTANIDNSGTLETTH